MSILMSRDQIHEEAMTFVRQVMSVKTEEERGQYRNFLVYFPGGAATITLAAQIELDPFMVWAQVNNNLTNKVMTTYAAGTDDPLILYTQVTDGINQMLRSIEWRVNQNERRAVLDGLVNLARGDG